MNLWVYHEWTYEYIMNELMSISWMNLWVYHEWTNEYIMNELMSISWMNLWYIMNEIIISWMINCHHSINGHLWLQTKRLIVKLQICYLKHSKFILCTRHSQPPESKLWLSNNCSFQAQPIFDPAFCAANCRPVLLFRLVDVLTIYIVHLHSMQTSSHFVFWNVSI